MSEERREYLELLEELVTTPSTSQHEKTMANRGGLCQFLC